MSNCGVSIVVIDGKKREKVAGTTLKTLQVSFPGCYLRTDEREIHLSDYVLESGAKYKLIKKTKG